MKIVKMEKPEAAAAPDGALPCRRLSSFNFIASIVAAKLSVVIVACVGARLNGHEGKIIV